MDCTIIIACALYSRRTGPLLQSQADYINRNVVQWQQIQSEAVAAEEPGTAQCPFQEVFTSYWLKSGDMH